MRTKKNKRNKDSGLNKIQSIVPKNLDLAKINPFKVIEDTKNKFGDFYSNLKKEKERENRRLDKKENKKKKEKSKDEKNKIKLTD